MSSIFRMEIDIESSDRFGIGPWSPPSGSAGTFMFCWRVRRPEFPKGLEPFCQVTINDRDGIQNSCHKIYYVYGPASLGTSPPPTPWLWVYIVAPQYPPPPVVWVVVGGGGGGRSCICMYMNVKV